VLRAWKAFLDFGLLASVVIVKYDGLNDTLCVCSTFVSSVTYFPVSSISDHAHACDNAVLMVHEREPRCASINE